MRVGLLPGICTVTLVVAVVLAPTFQVKLVRLDAPLSGVASTRTSKEPLKLTALSVTTWLLEDPTGNVTDTDEFVPGGMSFPAA